jgi:hypothetical protein
MSSAAHQGAAPTAASGGCELSDVFARYGDAYLREHRLRPARYKALAAIRACRTALLGGHREWCDGCGFERYLYHSCRNRHCPKCQTAETAAWVEARQSELLPVPHFHNVFTLPHEFNPLILRSERNQRALLKLLFDAAAETLLQFGRQTFGGKIGFLLVLHTWDQQLRAHFHVHALIPSGALSDDGCRWIAGGRRFLFPVRGLSKMFRGKYMDGVARLLERDELDIPSPLSALGNPTGRRRLLRAWRRKSCVVYSKAPFAGPRKLVDYLGRYTHRVAISNHRLLSCDNGEVSFTYRDRGDGDRRKTARLPAEQFLGRFLQHVLPDRFMRIRHYGLLANRDKQQRLARCRELLGAAAIARDESPSSRTTADWMLSLGIDITRCPCCGDVLHREVVPPKSTRIVVGAASSSAVVSFIPWDTS